MRVPVSLPGFESHRIEVEAAGFARNAVFVDGQPAPKGPKRGQFLLHRADDAPATVELRSRNLFDPIPQLVLDGQVFTIVEPLKWYQWLWAGLPFLLIAVGGAMGGLFGGLAMVANIRIMRSGLNRVARYAATGGVTILAMLIFGASALAWQSWAASTAGKPTEYRAADGSFSVVAPVPLDPVTQTDDIPGVGAIDTHVLVSDAGPVLYYASYADYPAHVTAQRTPAEMLAGSRDGAARSVNGEIIDDRAIVLGDQPGRAFTIDGADKDGQLFTLWVRHYLVENRLYQVMAMTARDADQQGPVDQFLDSFTLLK